MGKQIIFAGDKTLDELIDDLFEISEGEGDVTAVCDAGDEYPGYRLMVTLQRKEEIHDERH